MAIEAGAALPLIRISAVLLITQAVRHTAAMEARFFILTTLSVAAILFTAAAELASLLIGSAAEGA